MATRIQKSAAPGVANVCITCSLALPDREGDVDCECGALYTVKWRTAFRTSTDTDGTTWHEQTCPKCNTPTRIRATPPRTRATVKCENMPDKKTACGQAVVFDIPS